MNVQSTQRASRMGQAKRTPHAERRVEKGWLGRGEGNTSKRRRIQTQEDGRLVLQATTLPRLSPTPIPISEAQFSSEILKTISDRVHRPQS